MLNTPYTFDHVFFNMFALSLLLLTGDLSSSVVDVKGFGFFVTCLKKIMCNYAKSKLSGMCLHGSGKAGQAVLTY